MAPSAPQNRPATAHFRAFEDADGPLLADWLGQAGLRVPPDLADGRCERLRDDPRILLRTAVTQDGRPLGFSRLDVAPDDTGEITLIVKPDRRGRGLGRGLLEDVIEQGRHLSLRRLYAVVEEHNVVALGFFVSAGFERTGVWMSGYVHLHRLLHRSHADPEPIEIDP